MSDLDNQVAAAQVVELKARANLWRVLATVIELIRQQAETEIKKGRM